MNLPFSLPLTNCQQSEMRQRLSDTTKWLWYVLIIYSGPAFKPVRCIKVALPPKNPATVEAQAKFFQDFFSVQLSPYKIEFGHVCEDPNNWEQRYERKDYKNHRDMGKVRWGDKKGGYGEHYWDLNHAGHSGNHGDDSYDDGSYHDDGNNDSYDEPSEESPSYGTEEYDPETATKYENGRAKRAHSKQQHRKDSVEQKETRRTSKQQKKNEQPQSVSANDQIDESGEEETYQKHTNVNQRNNNQQKSNHDLSPDETEQVREKNQVVLVVGHKEREVQETGDYAPRQLEAKHYVPYEGGAGVRQHQHPERQVTAATNAPRLFLEPSTGHVVDRATGQAYVLQPLIQNPNYR